MMILIMNILTENSINSAVSMIVPLQPFSAEESSEIFDSFIPDVVDRAATHAAWADRRFARINARAHLLAIKDLYAENPAWDMHLNAHLFIDCILSFKKMKKLLDRARKSPDSFSSVDEKEVRSKFHLAFFNDKKSASLEQIVDNASDYVEYQDSLAAFSQPQEAFVLYTLETMSETEYDGLVTARESVADAASDDKKIQSDREIAEKINQLIDEMQQLFMSPFMDATDIITKYYNTISTIRDLMASNVTEGKDNKVTIAASKIYESLVMMVSAYTNKSLYPIEGFCTDKSEAEAWCEKMGVGVVGGEVVNGRLKYKVIVDVEPLKQFVYVFNDSVSNDYIFTDISQTVYNNLLSSMDSFLQKEQNKMSKITNQLEYFNKLVNNVQDTVMQFFKQMTEVATNFLRF